MCHLHSTLRIVTGFNRLLTNLIQALIPFSGVSSGLLGKGTSLFLGSSWLPSTHSLFDTPFDSMKYLTIVKWYYRNVPGKRPLPGKRPCNCFGWSNEKRPLPGKRPGNVSQDNTASVHQNIQEYKVKILVLTSCSYCNLHFFFFT